MLKSLNIEKMIPEISKRQKKMSSKIHYIMFISRPETKKNGKSLPFHFDSARVFYAWSDHLGAPNWITPNTEPEHQMGPPVNHNIASLLGEESNGQRSIVCHPIKGSFVVSNAVTCILINRGLQPDRRSQSWSNYTTSMSTNCGVSCFIFRRGKQPSLLQNYFSRHDKHSKGWNRRG